MFVLIHLLLSFSLAKNYAILLGTSKNFFNYRHNTNLLVFYHILLKNGFADTDIATLVCEDILGDDRNIKKDAAYLTDNLSIPNYRMDSQSFTLSHVINLLECYHSKLKDINESSNLFVYFCGHGTENYLDLFQRNYFTKTDLMRAINTTSRRVKKMLIIADTCMAECLFDRDNMPLNVFALSTSTAKEPSVSSFYSKKMGISLVDNFPYHFYSFVNKLDDLKKSITSFFSDFSKDKIESTLTYDNTTDFASLEEIITQNDFNEILPFRL